MTCRGTLPCTVKVLLEGEEEIGSPHMPEFMRLHHGELQADLMIISDGPVHDNGQSIISFGVRDMLGFELRARGANQDLHAGNWGGVVPNPLWTLVHLLATMKNERGEITTDGFYDNVQPLTQLEREALAKLPIDIEQVKHTLDLPRLDQPQESGYFERLAAWPTRLSMAFMEATADLAPKPCCHTKRWRSAVSAWLRRMLLRTFLPKSKPMCSATLQR